MRVETVLAGPTLIRYGFAVAVSPNGKQNAYLLLKYIERSEFT